jgi:hypothetical protein
MNGRLASGVAPRVRVEAFAVVLRDPCCPGLRYAAHAAHLGSSMGIYGEVSGEKDGSNLNPRTEASRSPAGVGEFDSEITVCCKD